MQRQSLGSPGSKLQIHGGKEEKLEGEEKRKGVEEEEEKKAEKLIRSSSRTEKSVHLIPILMIFCFLVLYLVSHDPSQKDLISIGAHNRTFSRKDSTEVEDIGRLYELEKSELLPIHGHRSLQEVRKGSGKSRPLKLHRKFGDF
ncbi:uncharacterized protein LOC131248001 [Magnolia sinica]|uniref:uncharacterized protein LOC131248001 n=1 Tax=Magnolia sinica TaxID=86752 RepID=UPI0026587680|nr:uncharacterized protein LOC131248001 [Magnolia sinica]